MEILPSSGNEWRREVAGLMFLLFYFVIPFRDPAGAPAAGLLYWFVLEAFISRQVAFLLCIGFSFLAGILAQNSVMRVLMLGGAGFLTLTQGAELLWGPDVANIVAGLLILGTVAAVMYVFGGGKEDRI